MDAPRSSRSKRHGPRSRAALLLAFAALPACQTASDSAREVSAGSDDCALCHVDEWSATAAPPHQQAEFAEACGACHDQERWAPAAGFVHAASFPLTLGHAERACGDCHTQGYAAGVTSLECVACHAARADAVVDPVHRGLIRDCFACHRTDTFWPARFIHSWPLTGVHALTSCRSCHGAGADARYEGTAPACIGCHSADRARADENSLPHRSYSDACDGCHGFETFAL